MFNLVWNFNLNINPYETNHFYSYRICDFIFMSKK
jgi:hypothetical protein